MVLPSENVMDLDLLKCLYSGDVPLTSIAKTLGCSTTPVSRVIRELGLTRQTIKPSHSVCIDDKELISLYRSGYSRTRLATKYSCSVPAVTKRLRSLGIKDTPPRTDIDENLLVILYEDGYSTSELASKFECQPSTIGKRLRKIGISLRKTYGIFSAEDEIEVVLLRTEENMSSIDIASRFKCSSNAVRHLLKRKGVPTSNIRTKVNERIDTEDVIQRYKEMNIAQLSRYFNCTGQLITKILIEAKVDINSKPNIVHLDVDKVTRMYKSGMVIREIAGIFGVSRSTIRGRLLKAEIPIRPSGEFGSIRLFKAHGQLVKLGSGWEARVYSILWREFGDGGFLFQGEFGSRKERCTPKFILNKPLTLPEKYRAKYKTVYTWHPDFVIPSLNAVIEVKGGWRATQTWNQCIIPCLKSTSDLNHKVYEMRSIPYKIKTWKGLKKVLTRIC